MLGLYLALKRMAKRLHSRLPYPPATPVGLSELLSTEVGAHYLTHCSSKAICEFFDLYKVAMFRKEPAGFRERLAKVQTELSQWLEDLEKIDGRLTEICAGAYEGLKK